MKPGPDRVALAAMLQREGYLPVWLESGLLDLYYNGFCNSVLWQLFHYVPLQLDGWQRLGEHQTLQMQWGAYQQVRQVPDGVWGGGAGRVCGVFEGGGVGMAMIGVGLSRPAGPCLGMYWLLMDGRRGPVQQQMLQAGVCVCV